MSLRRPTDHVRLHGTSVLAAPLLVVAVMTFSLAVASTIWAAFGDRDIGSGVVAAIVVPAAIGALALLTMRGCFVEVDGVDAGVRDVAGWVTVRRIDQASITAAHVRRGVWRLYVLDLSDGSSVKLVGASPQQFPARLAPDAARLDRDDLDVLLGTAPRWTR